MNKYYYMFFFKIGTYSEQVCFCLLLPLSSGRNNFYCSSNNFSNFSDRKKKSGVRLVYKFATAQLAATREIKPFARAVFITYIRMIHKKKQVTMNRTHSI